MSELVLRVQPERWKVFQVIPIGGQNDGAVEDLLFDNSAGHHTYSAPIQEVGVARALRQIRFSLARLVARGGKYAW